MVVVPVGDIIGGPYTRPLSSPHTKVLFPFNWAERPSDRCWYYIYIRRLLQPLLYSSILFSCNNHSCPFLYKHYSLTRLGSNQFKLARLYGISVERRSAGFCQSSQPNGHVRWRKASDDGWPSRSKIETRQLLSHLPLPVQSQQKNKKEKCKNSSQIGLSFSFYSPSGPYLVL